MKLKVLNLYAGIGGNRRLWDNVKVTAIELNPEIAGIYSTFFPDDEVLIEDAHQYLLDNFQDYDFIWSSPPCPTHSHMRRINFMLGRGMKYPDMQLYQEIILLKHWSKRKYCVENVISYYDPLIMPQTVNRHYFWANFIIQKVPDKKRPIMLQKGEWKNILKREELFGFELKKIGLPYDQKIKLLKNCVEPELGFHILHNAFRNKQETLTEVMVGDSSPT
jgi:DNA (cytosine-5)-methyltransferase 1